MEIYDRLKIFFERHWQTITVCMLAFVFIMQLFTMQKTYAVRAAAITDWGLGFGDTGTQPRGNLSAEALLKNNAYYIGSSDEKVIYLTFDAGYENGNTSKILDVLKKQEVTAAFFLVAYYLKTNPELVKRMADEGHIVANHTATHSDMSEITDAESLKAELEPVEELYREITGLELAKLYRPPQGKFCEKNLESAKQLGYTTVFWSLAYADWDVKNQPARDYALNKLNSRIHNGAIVLLHCTSATNAEILDELITGWKAEGYVFKSLYDLTGTTETG